MTTDPIDSELYGPLFAEPAYARIFSDSERLGAMLRVEAALARAQARCGVIPEAAADVIAGNCRAERFDMAAIGRAGAMAGNPVIPMVTALSALCGADAGRYVHWGATTQDIADTALVLQIRDVLALLKTDLTKLIKTLAGLAKTRRDTVMAGRTFMQQALPTTFGCRAALWLSPMLRNLERLGEIGPRLLSVQFAGAAGTLASLGDDGLKVQAALARELGLAAPDMAWHAARDRFAEVSGLCGLVAGACAKIATDVALLMMTEIGEVFEASGNGRGGSSTMPHKRNPVSSTLIKAQAGQVHALVPVMLHAMAGEHERAAGPWHGEWLALPQILVLTGSALARTAQMCDGLEIDEQRMRANLNATGGLLMAEAVMMALAPHLGRQQAHHLLEEASRQAVGQGRHLREVLGENPAVTGVLDAHALDALFKPENYTGQAAVFADRLAAMAETALKSTD